MAALMEGAAAAAAVKARGFAGILSSESAGVMAVMRQNSKWALVAPGYGYGDDEAPDDPLLEEFKAVRRRLFGWHDWDRVAPGAYLAPFLQVIRSVETSGPITGMALSAVLKVLKHGLISEDNLDAAEAMHCIADAVTLCRFEATDPDHDDVVLSKILHVLLECMLCPTGRLLSDDDVCNIVQACYRIGHQSGKESALLRNLSRHILREIVHAVFRRLPHLREASAAAAEGVHHIEGKTPSTPKARSAAARVGTGGGEVGAEAAAVAAVAEMGPGAVPASPTKGVAAAAATAAAVAANPIESAAPDDSTSPRGGGGVGPSKPHGEPFGLACVLEIFRFSVSFISLEDGTDENAESMCAFGLQLVLASLESAGEDFERHAPLLALVQDDLSRAVLAVAPAGHPPVLAATAATVLQLYMVMPLELKLQLEAFLRMVLLPLGEGRGEIPQESQRIALECIVDLCRQPNFVPDLYINFDCDLERPNLFEELTALLSRNAFPVNCPLNATHLLSLEGLLAVVAGIADRSTTAAPTGDDDDDAKAGPALDAIPAAYVDIWGSAAAG
eukprot:CAMPEP_0181358802 /NCGR_PEP_ID=MMETSP1106-20121128/5723_1 /TAXON_ID=81844 /ORGANISM="Mantoniella antarctica, Strain SL-175" /LENGTH=559 /DNA_ID=CAMNT_0023471825 /DNA_START=202 /DNA_END=1878 /DNA_ORIENTATION=-